MSLNFIQPKKIKKKTNKEKEKIMKVLFFCFTVYLVFSFIVLNNFVILPALNGYKIYSKAKNIAYSLFTDIKNNNLFNVEFYLSNIKAISNDILDLIKIYDFLNDIPYTKGYYKNIEVTKNLITQTTDLLIDVFPKLKNVLSASGFDTGLGFVDKEQSVITTILKEMPIYLEIYQNIFPKIENLLNTFAMIDTEYIPNIDAYDIKSLINRIKKISNSFTETSTKIAEFLKHLPSLVGSDKKTSYLVIFQNETEMRGSGGLLTAFGVLNIENGKIIDDFEVRDAWKPQYDIWNYGIVTGLNNIYGQEFLMNNGCGATELRIQDAGMYPDLVKSIELFLNFYDRLNSRLPEKYPKYDHVIILNLNFAEKVLEALGEINYKDEVITADFLFDFIKIDTDSNEYLFTGAERKQIIGDLAEIIQEKIISLSINEVSKLINVFVAGFLGRDIALYSKDSNIMRFLDSYELTGRFDKDYPYDYLHVNEAQNCALKMNKFLRNNVVQDINIQNNGNIKKNVSINWIQEKVYEPRLEKQYSVYINFLYRAWIRFVIPNGSTNIQSDGLVKSGFLAYRPIVYFDNVFNRLVSDNVIRFDHRRLSTNDPPKTHNLNISYYLPETLNFHKNDKTYRLLIQKHPGKDWEIYKININYEGSTYSTEFVLDQDKEIIFKENNIKIKNYRTSLNWITEFLSLLRD